MAGLWITVPELGQDYETSEYAAEAVQAASYLMWTLSGRKYSGTTTVTERYVRFAPLLNTHLLQETALINSRINKSLEMIEPWVSAETRIRLRGQPVSKITAVRGVTGDIFSPDDYYLVDRSTLQFQSGVLVVPADVEVTYTFGTTPPVLGKMAARRIAQEFIKLWEGDETCALPDRVTSVSRQGVSYTILDSQDFIQEMRLGIYEIDLFLKAVNPNKAQRRSKVFSPDLSRARRYTTKPLKLTETVRDFTIGKTGGTKTMSLASLNAAFLGSEAGWTLELIVRSYDNTRNFTFTSEDNIEVVSTNLVITLPYATTQSVLKMVDSGTYDIYATKNNATSLIASGNLVLDMTL